MLLAPPLWMRACVPCPRHHCGATGPRDMYAPFAGGVTVGASRRPVLYGLCVCKYTSASALTPAIPAGPSFDGPPLDDLPSSSSDDDDIAHVTEAPHLPTPNQLAASVYDQVAAAMFN